VGKTYVISAHGARYPALHYFTVPNKVTIHFYSDITGFLADQIAMDQLKKIFGDNVRPGRTGARLAVAFEGAENIPNYGCWDMNLPGFPSGVIRVKDRRMRMSFAGLDEGHPVRLKSIIDALRQRSPDSELNIHCLFCTSASTRIPIWTDVVLAKGEEHP
jgi:hypothetical protein